MTGKADLVWARALDQAVREVSRLRGTADLTVDQECEVSAALAAAVIALVDQTDRAGLDVGDLELVARTELAAIDRFRRARRSG